MICLSVIFHPPVSICLQAGKREDPFNDSIHKIIYCFRFAVERRRCRTDYRSCKSKRFHVFYVNEVVWSLSRNKDQLSSLLQHHVGSSCDKIVRCSASNSSKY